MLRRLLGLAAVLGMVAVGLVLVQAGLRTGPPEATPTPPAAVRMDADEARRIATTGAGVEDLRIPEDADLGPFVRTTPVPPRSGRTGCRSPLSTSTPGSSRTASPRRTPCRCRRTLPGSGA